MAGFRVKCMAALSYAKPIYILRKSPISRLEASSRLWALVYFVTLAVIPALDVMQKLISGPKDTYC